MYRPDLPDFGAFISWPEPGSGWIHPDDISTASQLIPSRRVFCRTAFDGTFYSLAYGSIQIRVKPTLWTSLPKSEVLPGDRVEVLSNFGKFEPGVATVLDVLCNKACDGFVYRLRRGEMTSPQEFSREQFRLLTLRYRLRSGYYSHQPPKFVPPDDLQLLNVGELIG